MGTTSSSSSCISSKHSHKHVVTNQLTKSQIDRFFKNWCNNISRYHHRDILLQQSLEDIILSLQTGPCKKEIFQTESSLPTIHAICMNIIKIIQGHMNTGSDDGSGVGGGIASCSSNALVLSNQVLKQLVIVIFALSGFFLPKESRHDAYIITTTSDSSIDASPKATSAATISPGGGVAMNADIGAIDRYSLMILRQIQQFPLFISSTASTSGSVATNALSSMVISPYHVVLLSLLQDPNLAKNTVIIAVLCKHINETCQHSKGIGGNSHSNKRPFSPDTPISTSKYIKSSLTSSPAHKHIYYHIDQYCNALTDLMTTHKQDIPIIDLLVKTIGYLLIQSTNCDEIHCSCQLLMDLAFAHKTMFQIQTTCRIFNFYMDNSISSHYHHTKFITPSPTPLALASKTVESIDMSGGNRLVANSSTVASNGLLSIPASIQFIQLLMERLRAFYKRDPAFANNSNHNLPASLSMSTSMHNMNNQSTHNGNTATTSASSTGIIHLLCITLWNMLLRDDVLFEEFTSNPNNQVLLSDCCDLISLCLSQDSIHLKDESSCIPFLLLCAIGQDKHMKSSQHLKFIERIFDYHSWEGWNTWLNDNLEKSHFFTRILMELLTRHYQQWMTTHTNGSSRNRGNSHHDMENFFLLLEKYCKTLCIHCNNLQNRITVIMLIGSFDLFRGLIQYFLKHSAVYYNHSPMHRKGIRLMISMMMEKIYGYRFSSLSSGSNSTVSSASTSTGLANDQEACQYFLEALICSSNKKHARVIQAMLTTLLALCENPQYMTAFLKIPDFAKYVVSALSALSEIAKVPIDEETSVDSSSIGGGIGCGGVSGDLDNIDSDTESLLTLLRDIFHLLKTFFYELPHHIAMVGNQSILFGDDIHNHETKSNGSVSKSKSNDVDETLTPSLALSTTIAALPLLHPPSLSLQRMQVLLKQYASMALTIHIRSIDDHDQYLAYSVLEHAFFLLCSFDQRLSQDVLDVAKVIFTHYQIECEFVLVESLSYTNLIIEMLNQGKEQRQQELMEQRQQLTGDEDASDARETNTTSQQHIGHNSLAMIEYVATILWLRCRDKRKACELYQDCPGIVSLLYDLLNLYQEQPSSSTKSSSSSSSPNPLIAAMIPSKLTTPSFASTSILQHLSYAMSALVIHSVNNRICLGLVEKSNFRTLRELYMINENIMTSFVERMYTLESYCSQVMVTFGTYSGTSSSNGTGNNNNSNNDQVVDLIWLFADLIGQLLEIFCSIAVDEVLGVNMFLLMLEQVQISSDDDDDNDGRRGGDGKNDEDDSQQVLYAHDIGITTNSTWTNSMMTTTMTTITENEEETRSFHLCRLLFKLILQQRVKDSSVIENILLAIENLCMISSNREFFNAFPKLWEMLFVRLESHHFDNDGVIYWLVRVMKRLTVSEDDKVEEERIHDDNNNEDDNEVIIDKQDNKSKDPFLQQRIRCCTFLLNMLRNQTLSLPSHTVDDDDDNDDSHVTNNLHSDMEAVCVCESMKTLCEDKKWKQCFLNLIHSQQKNDDHNDNDNDIGEYFHFLMKRFPNVDILMDSCKYLMDALCPNAPPTKQQPPTPLAMVEVVAINNACISVPVVLSPVETNDDVRTVQTDRDRKDTEPVILSE